MKNLLFDLDGTLIDSSQCIRQVYTDLFCELGIKMCSEEEFFTYIGPSIRETMKKYFDGEKLDRAVKRFREIYVDVDFAKTNKLYPGVAPMLVTLRNQGYKIYITTTKNQVFARKILEVLGADGYFDDIFGSLDDIGRISKSDVLRACFDSGVDKNDCILIGDTKFDYEGATEVGIPIGIVSYGFGKMSDFEGKQVKFFADSPSDIVQKLEDCYGKNY